MNFPCPLCQSPQSELYCELPNRFYLCCRDCELIFLAPKFHLDAQAEKTIYDQHQNESTDLRYRQFLAKLFDPINERLKKGQRGLDFGCGPGPTLSKMFDENSHQMDIYDPYYFPHTEVFGRTYDFITMSEVAEHLSDPNTVFNQLIKMLKPGGILGVMTQLVPLTQEFKDWHYKNDPTHIVFYQQKSFYQLAQKHDCEVEFILPSVIILTKKFATSHSLS